jgi:hypothetical protein
LRAVPGRGCSVAHSCNARVRQADALCALKRDRESAAEAHSLVEQRMSVHMSLADTRIHAIETEL